MSFKVIPTDPFDRQVKKLSKKYKSFKNDLAPLFDSLEDNPKQGESLGKHCYKIRLAIKSKGKGKSGGARLITYVKVIDSIVYLLAIYDKSDKESMSDKELDELLKMVGLQP